MRLDRFLSENADFSRARIQKDIVAGRVKVNGSVQNESKFVVRLDDEIEYDPQTEAAKISARHLDLKILFENDDILIIDKSAGMVVHPAPGYGGITLAEGLLARYGIADFSGNFSAVGEDEIRPGIVHRLDKDTSGVMLVAKTQQMFNHLKDAFAERKIKKEYLALACGRIVPKHNIINLPLGKHPKDFRKMSAHLPKNPKQAITEYNVLEYLEAPQRQQAQNAAIDEYTLVRVKLHTGRTHQIRVHFSSLGFPLAGDALYGKCRAPLLQRQFLHASKIEVQLPDGTWIEAQSDLPEDLQKVLNNLRNSSAKGA